jgi:hypothetical protein
MFKTLLEEYQAVQNQSKREVKEVQFNKPFPSSKLHEHSSKELSEILYEERRKSYLIPKGSIQEKQYHSFVSEAVAILEFVQSAGKIFVNSIQKSKEAHDKGDTEAAKIHFKNAKKSRYTMNEKDLDQATPHFKTYKELQKRYDDKAGVAESQELDELSTELLGRYKKAASVSATAADARKDFKTGNKRFSGIMKATNKQFDNDMKKLKKESADIELDGDQ